MNGAVKYIRILLNIFITVGTVFVVCYFGPKVAVFFMPFLIGWIIAMIANPLVKYLEKHMKLLRKHSSAIIVVLVLAALVVAGYFLIHKIVVETGEFIQNFPVIAANMKEKLQHVSDRLAGLYDMLPKSTRTTIKNATDSLDESFKSFLKSKGDPTVKAVGHAALNIPNLLIQIIVTILSSYFFIAERDKIIVAVNRMIPELVAKNVKLAWNNVKFAVGGYFKAQFKIMGVVFVILIIGFLILGTDYAIILAFFIALLDFLPFFGTGTVLVPWSIVCFFNEDIPMAVGLLIIYGVSQLIRQIIQPKIVGDSMGLNPLLTLFLLYIGFKVSGVGGMILAVPVGMIFINFYKVGAFDQAIDGVKEILHDINRFRKGH